MPGKKQGVLLKLTQLEQKALKGLSIEQGMSELGIIRQALRLYQLCHHKFQEGSAIKWVNKKGEIAEGLVKNKKRE